MKETSREKRCVTYNKIVHGCRLIQAVPVMIHDISNPRTEWLILLETESLREDNVLHISFQNEVNY